MFVDFFKCLKLVSKCALIHPAGTSIVSDICDLSKVCDIEPLTWGSMRKSFFYHLFCMTHKIYFSKDFWEIYIKKFNNKIWRYGDIYGSNKDDPDIYGFLSH